MKALNISWYKGTKGDDQRVERQELVRSHAALLALLTDILKQRHDEVLKEAQKRIKYDGPSWAYEQADYNATMRTLRELLELTDLTED